MYLCHVVPTFAVAVLVALVAMVVAKNDVD